MKKRLLFTATAFMLVIMSVFSASALEKKVTLNGVTYELTENKNDGKYYEVKSFYEEGSEETTKEITIVEEINNVPVLSVSRYGDKEIESDSNYSVEKINLPEGLKYIKEHALSNFKKVENITLPSTLVSVEYGGLRGMESLKSIVIPKGVTKIETAVFDGCRSLSKVTFKGKIKTIDSNAFSGCTGLKKITLPESVKKIGAGAFRKSGLVSVNVPSKADVSSPEIFRDCSKLEKVIFNGCERKKGLVLGTRVFSGCKLLEKVSFPENTECIKIGYETFKNCKSLKSFTISKNVSEIGEKAFYGCSKLKKVTFDNAKKAPVIGSKAFSKVAKGIDFFAANKKVAKSIRTNLKASGMKNPDIYYITYTKLK